MNRRTFMTSLFVPAAISSWPPAQYKVTKTLIEDTCKVPYTVPRDAWWDSYVIVSGESLQKMIDVLHQRSRRRNCYVNWALVRDSIRMV